MNPLEFVESYQAFPQRPIPIIEALAKLHLVPEDYLISVSVDCSKCSEYKVFKANKKQLQTYSDYLCEAELKSEFLSINVLGIIFNRTDSDLLRLISRFKCIECQLKEKGVYV